MFEYVCICVCVCLSLFCAWGRLNPAPQLHHHSSPPLTSINHLILLEACAPSLPPSHISSHPSLYITLTLLLKPQAYAHETQLTRRVADWQDRVEPMLELQVGHSIKKGGREGKRREGCGCMHACMHVCVWVRAYLSRSFESIYLFLLIQSLMTHSPTLTFPPQNQNQTTNYPPPPYQPPKSTPPPHPSLTPPPPPLFTHHPSPPITPPTKERRTPFDIHDCGDEILSSLSLTTHAAGKYFFLKVFVGLDGVDGWVGVVFLRCLWDGMDGWMDGWLGVGVLSSLSPSPTATRRRQAWVGGGVGWMDGWMDTLLAWA